MEKVIARLSKERNQNLVDHGCCSVHFSRFDETTFTGIVPRNQGIHELVRYPGVPPNRTLIVDPQKRNVESDYPNPVFRSLFMNEIMNHDCSSTL
jgi:hypothetical protein